ncbi:MAG: hypothetical protein ACR2NF_07375 [Pirellulales bacterium]
MSKENNYIKFQCSKGLHVLTAPKRFAGKKGRCLSCYEELTIPNRTPDDFIPPPQNLSDDDAEDYEKYLADNYSDSDSVRFEQTLNPGDLSVKANCGRCKEAFTFCSSLPDPRKGNFTLFELDKLKKLPKNFDTRFYCIDCLTEFFRGSHTSRPSQEEISQSPGLSYEVDGKTYLKPLGEGLKQRIPARPESEVLAERKKKQEPLSNDNKRTDFAFFRQTLNQQSDNRSTLPVRRQTATSNNSGASALPPLLIAIGVVIVLLALRMDTTVQVPGANMRVHNLSLATQQRNYLTLGCLISAVGMFTGYRAGNSDRWIKWFGFIVVILGLGWLIGTIAGVIGVELNKRAWDAEKARVAKIDAAYFAKMEEFNFILNKRISSIRHTGQTYFEGIVRADSKTVKVRWQNTEDWRPNGPIFVSKIEALLVPGIVDVRIIEKTK